MAGCENCGGCGGGGTLQLTQAELDALRQFAQIPFFPLGRRPGDETPVCREEGLSADVLASMALKGLIRLDLDMPLSNFDYAAYADCTDKGSTALTAFGQGVLDLLDVRGAEE